MKKVLVTGGSGFIGSRIHYALRHEYDVLAVSSKEMNILDETAVSRTITEYRPDYVIHCAAAAVTDFCNRNPDQCHAVNVEGSINIAKACSGNQSRMVFLSTEQVFNGNTAPGPYRETDVPHPDTVYGSNKLDAEISIREICRDSLILRLTWMFGIPQRFRPAGTNILWDTVGLIMAGEPFGVPVNEYRGLSYVDELMEQLPEILNLSPGIYHTGSHNPMNRYETVCHIFREMGLGHRTGELVLADTVSYSGCSRDIRLDTTRLREAGVVFSESPDAISRCIREYGLIFRG